MQRIVRLRNPILPYAWGSRRALRALRGLAGEAPQPQAELWIGTHPKAPSEVWTGDAWMPLPDLVAADPLAVLGARVVARFGPRLPFLFKILAAAAPLSIQAHPDRAQARAGFLREQASGIALDAPERNYRDDSHKPELIYALTPFSLLRGFCPPAQIRDRIARLGLGAVWPEAAGLKPGPSALRRFFESCLMMAGARAAALVKRAAAAAASRVQTGDADLAERWLVRLAAAYPGDPGALAPLWLKVSRLAPGKAVFTGPGVLHAYLEGTCIELMASSDNVLRGGLTSKHVDLDALLGVLSFAVGDEGRVPARLGCDGAACLEVPAEEFALRVVTLDGQYSVGERDSVEVLLSAAGSAVLESDDTCELAPPGESFLIPAAVPGYRLQGAGTFFVASVP